MMSNRMLAIAIAVGTFALIAPVSINPATAQTPPAVEKLNAYVGCINYLSSRAYDSRSRYFSWVGKNGPTGKESVIYGTYAISHTEDCQKNAMAANALEPRDAALEAAASAYVTAVTTLAPLLKEADDYYTQENYKDDKMAKGKALHPRLVAAWDAFATADKSLRAGVETINDRRKAEELAAIEAKEGRSARYYVETLMVDAKRVLRTEDTTTPDVAAITQAVEAYENTFKATEAASAAGGARIGSMFVSNAKSYLVTAKQLMRRIRDKVPYSTGEKMHLSGSGSGWMVEGSPPRLLRDYNQLVDAYNNGARM